MKTQGCTSDEISQELSYFLRQQGNYVLPNVFIGSFERDMICLLPSGMWTEYEIKVSRGDFKQDFKKGHSSDLLPVDKKQYVGKHGQMHAGDPLCPNRFYFVVPEGLVDIEEIPPYAGLIYFKKTIPSLTMVRMAKMIHKNKRTEKFTLGIMEKCYHRYWDVIYRNKLLKSENKYLNSQQKKDVIS